MHLSRNAAKMSDGVNVGANKVIKSRSLHENQKQIWPLLPTEIKQNVIANLTWFDFYYLFFLLFFFCVRGANWHL